MYARATSGDKLNNNKFSLCSIRNISQVLEKKRNNCFVGMYMFPSYYKCLQTFRNYERNMQCASLYPHIGLWIVNTWLCLTLVC